MPATHSHGGNTSVEVPAWISQIMSNTVPSLFPKNISGECVSPSTIRVLCLETDF